MKDVKVIAFDTGGTVLDWHSGLAAAMAEWGAAHGIERDWHALANEHRRRSLRRMTNTIDPAFNIDDVHRDVCNELIDENQPPPAARRRSVARPHGNGTGLMPGLISPRRCADCGGTASVSRSRSSACR